MSRSRRHSAAFRAKVSLDTVRSDRTSAEIAQRHDAHRKSVTCGGASCSIVKPADRAAAHFSDHGRRFQRDRRRCFSAIVVDHGSTRVMGFIVSQSSTMAPKAIMDGRLLSPRWAEIRSSQRSHPESLPGVPDRSTNCGPASRATPLQVRPVGFEVTSLRHRTGDEQLELLVAGVPIVVSVALSHVPRGR